MVSAGQIMNYFSDASNNHQDVTMEEPEFQ